MATSKAFLDTNVLIYLASGNPDRVGRSEEVLSGGGVISVQVLNEFVNTTRSKYAFDWDAVETWLELFRSRLDVEPMTVETQARAVTIARRHQIHIYDATIIAAAAQAGCDVQIGRAHV